ncbi:urease accessory protein UreH [Xenococcus sp. PCC 7305]|uniref:urease accessory protein UreD n=1 Tax=Xenococcus sp. PCC 7305 TaxID=102125 RepID=UPI0002ACD42D|nr:urease accessory protein UreD [Xenococcus sp. PCC 7305]ELS00369.1 urease accessory protein UreH [Xenococcus sp. PCC 7305]
MISRTINNLATSKLDLKVRCSLSGQTKIFHQYTTHPLRVSNPFRLDKNNSHRLYLYLRNNSPGLLAEDELNLAVQLEQGSQLYLTEQAATKVHPVLEQNAAAQVNYQITIAENASLEFVPEPLILYADAALKQTTNITIYPNSNLFWSEIVIPGRLARGESYKFNYYDSCLNVTSSEGQLLFKDRSYLEGKNNQFKNSSLFAAHSIMGTAIAVYPEIGCHKLQKAIDNIVIADKNEAIVATSTLPYEQGIIIRALSNKSEQIKNYFRSALNSIRSLQDDSALPYIAK